nr:hypothetical protein [Moraxella osloensis]
MDKYLFLGNTNIYANISYILLGTMLFYFSMNIGYCKFKVPKFTNFSILVLGLLFSLGVWVGCSIIGAFLGLLLIINIVSPYLILRRQDGFIKEANKKEAL